MPKCSPSHIRLNTCDRRAQLLQVGRDLLGERPDGELRIADIAEAAGVSAGLIYQYFGNRHAFVEEVVRHELQALFDAVAPDPTTPLETQMPEKGERVLDYLETHRNAVLTVHWALARTDPAVHAIIKAAHHRLQGQLLATLWAGPGPAPGQLRLAIAGCDAYVTELCVRWMEDPVIDKTELRDLCIRSVLAIFASAQPVSP
ncbi:MAG: TetR/AcrR family transcriptional regulator [Segniliparus sp.]|uniref:TetR/AcrR family transcriptional regulator n=1 Tax=Segniliparus sp. TaxID=2804064 RepID=UPI003F416778